MRHIEMLVQYLNDMVCIVEIMEHSGEALSPEEWERRCSKYQERKNGCEDCYADWLVNDPVQENANSRS